MADSDTIPITFGPGVMRNSTAAGVGPQWHDSHLIRWVLGRMRPVAGWEKLDLAALPSPIRAMHVWIDQNGVERLGILCEKHLYVLEGPDQPGIIPDQLRNVTPVGGIVGPGASFTSGGYGNEAYDKGTYGTPRESRPDKRRIGEVWRLANWGENLLAMASTDGRLLQWVPGPDLVEPGVRNIRNAAKPVKNAPVGNRTFVVTAERHVMLFAMDGDTNKFGWCSQEDIEDWNFSSVENTAGFYSIEPASRIVQAYAAQYSIIFWTTQGAYVVDYKALPFIYTYHYLGQHAAPLSGNAAAGYSGTVIWPAANGFWQFDGTAVRQVECPILDWFQQTYDEQGTRAHMAGWFNGATSEMWWCFPAKRADGEIQIENDTLIIYNFEERWWSIGKLARTCGAPGSLVSYPLMATTTAIYRHEKGLKYPGVTEMPWVRSGFLNVEKGKVMATTRQLLVDTDADLDAVSYQLFASKGRYSQAPERTKGAKLPSTRRLNTQGKIDYRISGRDFAVKMASVAQPDGSIKPWTFGEGHVVVAPRGKRGAP